jgi:hypothetical protein
MKSGIERTLLTGLKVLKLHVQRLPVIQHSFDGCLAIEHAIVDDHHTLLICIRVANGATQLEIVQGAGPGDIVAILIWRDKRVRARGDGREILGFEFANRLGLWDLG